MSRDSALENGSNAVSLVLTAINAVRNIPSFAAAQPSSVGAAISLLVTPDQHGYTPLHYAAASGDYELLTAILEVLKRIRPSLVDVRDKSGATPLHWAVKRGHSRIIKALLETGASPLAEDAEGRSLLHYAIDAAASVPPTQRDYYYDMIRYLLQSGVDVAAADLSGVSCVHAAAALGDKELLGILVELGGAPVNLVDNEGENALFYAIQGGHLELVPMLLDYGIDPTVRNEADETVLDYCRALGDDDATRRLAAVLNGGRMDSMSVEEPVVDHCKSLIHSSGFSAMWNSNPAHLIR